MLSDDDTMTRAQSLCNSDIIYSGTDYPDDTSEDGLSPHGGPLMPSPFWHGESSPGKSTWKAGLGDQKFEFSYDKWRQGPQPLPEPQQQMTPSRRCMDVSIDSVSVDETWETPLGSRASTKSGRTPSMGNKLELDLKRSERNMRYNALHQEQARQNQRKTSSPVRMHARFILGGSSGDMDANEAQYYPEYTTASRLQTHRISSEDSIAISLRSASDNMEKLRAMLGDIESDCDLNAGDEVVDAFTTASSPRSKRASGRKSRGLRSDSPSPEKDIVAASHPLPATPILGPSKFSPTAPRDNTSPNRFTVLDAKVDIVSSPASDNTAIADLPTAYSGREENRIASNDTLDRTLDTLSSPASGYKADESSMVQTPDSGRKLPKRYRSQSNRKGGATGRRVLGELSGNERKE